MKSFPMHFIIESFLEHLYSKTISNEFYNEIFLIAST